MNQQKKLLRFILYCLFWGALGLMVWVGLRAYVQPLILLWGDFQIETTFRFAVFVLLLLFVVFSFLIQSMISFVRRLRVNKFDTLLVRLFQGVVFYAVDDAEQVEKILKKLDSWRDKTPWVLFGKLFWRRALGESIEAEIGALALFPEADPLITRLHIEQAVERGEGKTVWSLFIEAFEKGQKNPWLLTHFFREALRRRDLEWATRLFQKIRKIKLSERVLDSFNAQLFFLQAELLVGDPLRREFLLRRAQTLCPQDPQIALAFLAILADQGKKIELEKCLERSWKAFPDVRFVRVLLNFFKDEPASLCFRKVQHLLGDWKKEEGETLRLSALVSGFVAVKAKLETPVMEALGYLEGEHPLWAAFLRIFWKRGQDDLALGGCGEEMDKIMRDFVVGDPVLRDLMTGALL